MGRGSAMLAIPAGSGMIEEHPYQVSRFWIDQHKVTGAEYRACLEAGACVLPAAEADYCSPYLADPPAGDAIHCLSWQRADTYCRWAGKRLPAESEWDRAAQQWREWRGFDLHDMVDTFGEYTADYYCSEKIGGCGHARVFRGLESPTARWRQPEWSADLISRGVRRAWAVHAPPTPASAPPPLLAPTSSSPDKITCFTTTCDRATEACCQNDWDELGHCVPKNQGSCGDHGDSQRVPCNETADCPASKLCCTIAHMVAEGTELERSCHDAPCDDGFERCLAGGSCRTGFDCEVGPDGRTGRCRWRDVGASCGAQRCSGKKPVCCWSSKKRKGYCTEDHCAGWDETELACSDSYDCGGTKCATFSAPPGITYRCDLDVGITTTGIACTGKGCRGCRAKPFLPPGVKDCR